MTRCASRTTHDRVIEAIRSARAKMRGMATPHRLGVILAAALAMTKPALAANITKETLTIDRTSRTYLMFVPDAQSHGRCQAPWPIHPVLGAHASQLQLRADLGSPDG